MATIEERAKEYAKGLYPDMRDEELHSFSDCRRDYTHGAREQCKIDTDIICDLMIDMLNDGMIETRDIGAVNMRIRKAMEE